MKLIAIMPVRNEEWILRRNLQVLTQICDAVFVADHFSTDRTPDICREFPKVHYFQYDNASGRSDENRRHALLDAARSYKGCNVILTVDADEIITANVLTDPQWPRLLGALQPGESVLLQWVMLWKDPLRYRDDRSVWSDRWVTFLFRDDRKAHYPVGNWHESRIPPSFCESSRRFDGAKVLHYQFVAWERSLSKQVHCRMVELLRPRPSAVATNQTYIITKDERDMVLRDVPKEWIEPWQERGIDLTDFPRQAFCWYDLEILRLFSEHGVERFADLDMWDVDWERKRQLALAQGYDDLPEQSICDPRNLEQKLYHAYLNRYISTPLWRGGRELVRPLYDLARRLGLRRAHLERLGLLKPRSQ